MNDMNSLVQHARARYRLAGANLIARDDPFFVPIDAHRAAQSARGKSLVSFAHYDYLGLADHPAIIAAARTALDAHGPTVSASRMVGGERLLHRELEKEIASFTKTDDALALVSGYLTNVTLLGHIMASSDLILYDELCHNSILVGARASRAKSEAFGHNDMADLRARLRKLRGDYRKCLIVVEGLYSMDGDVAPLPELLELKNEFGCWLMADEAHSIGTLGKTGRGISEHFGIDVRAIDIIVGTLSKSFVSAGGFIAAHADVVRWLRYTLPGFVYSVGLAPATTASALTAIRTVQAEPERVAQLQSQSQFFMAEARRLGLETGPCAGCGVVPILADDEWHTLHLSRLLNDEGIYVPPIVRIGVPREKPRLRFFLSSRHTRQDMTRTLSIVAKANELVPADDKAKVSAVAK